jgi:hypothetical protein
MQFCCFELLKNATIRLTKWVCPWDDELRFFNVGHDFRRIEWAEVTNAVLKENAFGNRLEIVAPKAAVKSRRKKISNKRASPAPCLIPPGNIPLTPLRGRKQGDQIHQI